MGSRVDEEGCMVDDDNTEEATVDHTSKESVHTTQHHEACNTWKDNTDQETDQEDVAVLPCENTIRLKIFNVLNNFFSLVDHNPAHMGPHESFCDRIRIFFLIGLEVMPAMITAPLNG